MTHDINHYTDLIVRRIDALLNGSPYPPFVSQDVRQKTGEAGAETPQAIAQCGSTDIESSGNLEEGHAIT